MANVPIRPAGVKFYGVFDWHGDIKYFDPATMAATKACALAARNKGANLFIDQGILRAIPAGTTTLANLIAKRNELIKYLASIGMYSLCYYNNQPDQWLGLMTNATMISYLIQIIAQDALQPNVIGGVIYDEAYTSIGSAGVTDAAYVRNMSATAYAATKAVVPVDFPICSVASFAAGLLGAGSGFPSLGDAAMNEMDLAEPYQDFWAVHALPYGTTVAEAQPQAGRFPNKDIIMPSCVNDKTDTTSVTNLMNMTATAPATYGNTTGIRGWGYFLTLDLTYDGGSILNGMFNDNGASPEDITGNHFNSRSIPTTARSIATPFTGGVAALYPGPYRPIPNNPRYNYKRRWGNT